MRDLESEEFIARLEQQLTALKEAAGKKDIAGLVQLSKDIEAAHTRRALALKLRAALDSNAFEEVEAIEDRLLALREDALREHQERQTQQHLYGSLGGSERKAASEGLTSEELVR